MGYLLLLIPLLGTGLVLRLRGWKDRLSLATLGLYLIGCLCLIEVLRDSPFSFLALLVAALCWLPVVLLAMWSYGLKVREESG